MVFPSCIARSPEKGSYRHVCGHRAARTATRADSDGRPHSPRIPGRSKISLVRLEDSSAVPSSSAGIGRSQRRARRSVSDIPRGLSPAGPRRAFLYLRDPAVIDPPAGRSAILEARDPLSCRTRRIRAVVASSWAPWARRSSPPAGCSPTSSSARPPLTEGPFYPDKLPLDTDNDLIIVNDHVTPAVGEITHLTGRILGSDRDPRAERDRRDLAVRRQRGVPAHRRQRLDPQSAGQELPGLRPVHDRLDRRVLLPDDQARPVSRPARPAHPRQGEAWGPRAAHDPDHDRRPPGQRAGRRLPRRRRRPRPRADPGRVQAVARFEDRRVRRPLRRHPRPHPRRRDLAARKRTANR